jgi:hypothetical protein
MASVIDPALAIFQSRDLWLGLIGGSITSATVFLGKFGRHALKWDTPTLKDLNVNACFRIPRDYPKEFRPLIEHNGIRFRRLLHFNFFNNTEQAIYISNVVFAPYMRKKFFGLRRTRLRIHHISHRLPAFGYQEAYEIKFGPGEFRRDRFDSDTLLRVRGRQETFLALDDDETADSVVAGEIGVVIISFATKSGFGRRKFYV